MFLIFIYIHRFSDIFLLYLELFFKMLYVVSTSLFNRFTTSNICFKEVFFSPIFFQIDVSILVFLVLLYLQEKTLHVPRKCMKIKDRVTFFTYYGVFVRDFNKKQVKVQCPRPATEASAYENIFYDELYKGKIGFIKLVHF